MLKSTLVVAAILLITVASQPMPQYKVNVEVTGSQVTGGVKIPIGHPGNQGSGQEDEKRTGIFSLDPIGGWL